ncbi:MAG: MBL fold metallo-hydrolase [Oscillospiraceae bacterium]|nr:MBL fold metallo-hydrolase [Oscillospiraceae bacterium]
MKRLLSIIILLAVLMTACYFMPPESKLPAELTGYGTGLEVHFIDVGQADCALVICEGRAMLIDGGNYTDSSLIYSYLRDMGIRYLDCVIATHPHEDHIGGISGALCFADAGECFSPMAETDNSFFDKLTRKLDEKGIPLTVPSPGDGFSLGGASVTFLGPMEITNDDNDNSLVLRLVYHDVSFLFTGDAGEKAEKRILDSGRSIESTVLKVGHHGSRDSSSYQFLRAVNPAYAVISVEDNSRHGHPHEETLSRLYDSGAAVYRTDKNGTVVFRSDGYALIVNAEKGDATEAAADSAETDPAETAEPMYIGNISSQVYHRPNCHSLPSEQNRVYLYSLEEAVNSGFHPCGYCKP